MSGASSGDLQPATAIRSTRQRLAIAEALAACDEFRSAQQIHEQLRTSGYSIGLTTVYRNLQALADADQVDVLRNDNGESQYRHCSTGHHHHLVCRFCGATVEVQADPVERWAGKVAKDFGFSEVTHTVEVFGRCPACV
ncbi:Fur family transcriptional regulator [Williamsia sterculiae]|uniref:Zinc uptake regulator, Fur family n=1 Tax=Williamsia sterculiae TaxID=1344003 RepID=A0A1N7G778_9NOCA|nr:transcriptional repressor [Williamsia sterculiae]SIS08442.1 zinc uptake regulator, Fur family [Williamsia sterculiae]